MKGIFPVMGSLLATTTADDGLDVRPCKLPWHGHGAGSAAADAGPTQAISRKP
jgi:hypothetical protein